RTMLKHSEKSQQPERKSLGGEDIQATCTPIFLPYTNAQEDSMVAKARSPRCRFSPCLGTKSLIPSLTSRAILLRAKSTLIGDYTGKESIHQSTQHPPSLD